MKFKVINRHVWLEPVEEQEEQKNTILVPDDYKVQTQHKIYNVKGVADDCEKISTSSYEGIQVLVNNTMVEQMSVAGATYYLVLENYIYGIFEKEHESV